MKLRSVAFWDKNAIVGGGQVVTLQLMKALTEHGIQCYYLYEEKLSRNGLIVPQGIHGFVLPADLTEQLHAIPAFVQQHGIQIVCLTCENMSLVLQMQFPSFVKCVYICHTLPFSNVSSKLVTWGFPWYKKVHIFLQRQLKEYLFHTYSRRWKSFHRALYQKMDAFVTLHEDYHQVYKDKLGIDGSKLYAIPNMLTTDVSNHPKKKQILYCGRMSYRDKRVDRLLTIWNHIHRQLQDWELVLVGDGPELPKLKQYVQQHCLPRVRFEGWQPQTTPFYQQAAIVCLTSSFESFGLALTEGIAHGCVPLAFNCSSGVRQIIPCQELLIPAFDTDQFARRLVMLAKDEEARERYLQACRNRLNDFSPQKITAQWIAFFNQLLAIDTL